VGKPSWLSRKNVAKAYGSMVVYLAKGSDVQRYLRKGFFHVAGESGYGDIRTTAAARAILQLQAARSPGIPVPEHPAMREMRRRGSSS
jgi:hypothetical protein